MYSFERFEHVGGRYTPKISIRSNGQIGLSQGTLKRFNLVSGDWYVVLFYDRQHKVIGLKPTRSAEEPGATKLVKKNQTIGETETATAFVSGKAFLEYHGIDYKKTRQYEVKHLESEGMLIFEIG